jgi:hypothetical protein
MRATGADGEMLAAVLEWLLTSADGLTWRRGPGFHESAAGPARLPQAADEITILQPERRVDQFEAQPNAGTG